MIVPSSLRRASGDKNLMAGNVEVIPFYASPEKMISLAQGCRRRLKTLMSEIAILRQLSILTALLHEGGSSTFGWEGTTENTSN
jgi:hypothetical protein